MSLTTVAILAGGPSMTREAADAVHAAGVCSIVINNTWKLMPDAEFLFAADAGWWLERDPRVSPTQEEFWGERISCMEQVPDVRYVPKHQIGYGSTSALQAAWFAADRGAQKLLLLGVDLRDDQLTHHHGLHGGKLKNPTKVSFRLARAAWVAFAQEKNRPEVINCNPQSAVTCFPKMTIEEALA